MAFRPPGSGRRTSAQRCQDRCKMMQLMRRGWSKFMIASEMGVSVKCMEMDYKALMRQLLEEQKQEVVEMVAQKRLEYTEIKKEAWAAWERSKEDAWKRYQTESSFGGDKITESQEGRLPANEYLRTILSCLQAERELLALDPVKETRVDARVTSINWDLLSQEIPTGEVPDEIEREIQKVLESQGIIQPKLVEDKGNGE